MTFRVLIFGLMLISSVFAGDSDIIIVGVAEEKAWLGRDPGVRVMFVKQAGEWTALNYRSDHEQLALGATVWTIAFDGRTLGQLVTAESNAKQINQDEIGRYFLRDFSYRVEDPNKFPRIDNKEYRFAGWSGGISSRPLVVVNKPYFSDPEKWQRYSASMADLETLVPSIKERFGRIRECGGETGWDFTYHDVAADSYHHVRSYQNKLGEKLLQIQINDVYTEKCDGIPQADHKELWFYVSGNKAEFVGVDIDLVDAGDYDNDGEVEFMFFVAGYNMDGYMLFESKFKSSYTYAWQYH